MLKQDLDLKITDIQHLANADSIVGLFTALGYATEWRVPQTPAALGFPEKLEREVLRIERVADQEDGALQVYLVELKRVTVALTQSLSRSLKGRVGLFLLVLTTGDYQRLDFVLLDQIVPSGNTAGELREQTPILRPRILSVDRRNPDRVSLRVLRRFSYTEVDTDYQWDKLRSAYGVAEWSEPLFNNRALFSDYYLNERLPMRSEWKEDPRLVFRALSDLLADARQKFARQPESKLRTDLFERLFKLLGWQAQVGKASNTDHVTADYRLISPTGVCVPCLTYVWDRFLDGPDGRNVDLETPSENPAQTVVSILNAEEDTAGWAIVTNGKTWRLYSARAHSRATNYYEIDLEETLASPDVSEAFRYFWLFFRSQAFDAQPSFVDTLLAESASYAKALGERLKENVFENVFPLLAEGFIKDWGRPAVALSDDDLSETFHATLIFLYRLLFLLYAEARDLLPVKEARGYWEISLKRLKDEIAKKGGDIADLAPNKFKEAYSVSSTDLYDRLSHLFQVIDRGEPALNVPVYNGGLFITLDKDHSPIADETEAEELRLARFLSTHKIPDRFLAQGLDLLARDIDDKTQSLAMIDYKSLGVRQLGSIYEGLLEFKLRVAQEKMAVVSGKKGDQIVPYAEAKKNGLKLRMSGRGAARTEFVYPKGGVYLENDLHERKATGSYYTPDYIVKYIVQHTVGPALESNTEALRPKLREAQRAYHAAVERQKVFQKSGQKGDDPEKTAFTFRSLVDDLFDLRVLDPAMGSGHFLVETVDFITDRLLAFLNAFPWNPVTAALRHTRQTILSEMQRQGVSVDPARLTDVNLLKRHVLKRCIYGVDLNPMAVELAKVSLWLDCFTLGAPLSFLDHHLKCGNSLIGAQVTPVREEIEMVTTTRTKKVAETAQAYKTKQIVAQQFQMFGSLWAGAMLATDLMRQVGELPDTTAEQVHQSRAEYQRAVDALTPFKRILDVYTSRWFGNPDSKLNQPVLQFLRDEQNIPWLKDPQRHQPASLAGYRDIAETALKAAREKRFFHWELEFPEAFFGPSKASAQEIVMKENPGFDAVIGNPPYDILIRSEHGGEIIEYLNEKFFTAEYNPNLFALFSELALFISKLNGLSSLIIPNMWLTNDKYTRLRTFLTKDAYLRIVLDFEFSVFEEVIPTCVYVVQKSIARDQDMVLVGVNTKIHGTLPERFFSVSHQSLQDNAQNGYINQLNPNPIKFKNTVNLDIYFILYRGVETRDNNKYYSQIKRTSHDKPVLMAPDVERYFTAWGGTYVRFVPGELKSNADLRMYNVPAKVLIRRTGDRLTASLDKDGLLVSKNLYLVIPKSKPTADYLCAILNSRLLNWERKRITRDEGQAFAQISGTEILKLPICQINFNTPSYLRDILVGEAIALVENQNVHELITFIAARLIAQPEESDVVHDLLAALAQRMIDLNQQKQAEMKRFTGWLEGLLKISVDDLTGKSRLKNFLGDYQKGEAELSYAELEEILYKNKGKLGISLSDSRVQERLRAEYESSLKVLCPIKDSLAWTDRVIDQIVYKLYGLTEAEIAIVEGKTALAQEVSTIETIPTPVGRPQTIARVSDPNELARILQVLDQHGPLTTRQLADLLTDQRLTLGPDKAETIRREFAFLGWIETDESRWTLTERGKDLGSLGGDAAVGEFARQLCLDSEHHNAQVISRLLLRMEQLSPDLQGAVIFPRPELKALPDSLADVRKLLSAGLPRWDNALRQQVKNFAGLANSDAIADQIIADIQKRWATMDNSERTKRLQTRISEAFVEVMFGQVMAANDVEIWQERMDWAGLTHTARDLPGLQGHVWFPVGAFRSKADDFTPLLNLVNFPGDPDALTFYRYTPSGADFESSFMRMLYDGYRQVQHAQHGNEYVSLLTVRDWVCYRLRISHEVFEETLQSQFPRALRGEIPYSLALEVDVMPSELMRLGNARPVRIDKQPRYIIAMRSRAE